MRTMADPLPPDFPRTQHDICKHSVSVPAPYEVGDVIGSTELVLIQRALVDLVRDNLSKTLRSLPSSTDPALIRQTVDDFVRKVLINPVRYFGPTSKIVRAQHISAEKMEAAIEMVRAKINASSGLRVSDFTKSHIRLLAIELIEKQPELFTLATLSPPPQENPK